ncbi:MAG: hypothetical protein LBT05_13110 [Planctomycetaceae bacterium]|nr:hypothetical protein [Planctomycetaceae bacterium]
MSVFDAFWISLRYGLLTTAALTVVICIYRIAVFILGGLRFAALRAFAALTFFLFHIVRNEKGKGWTSALGRKIVASMIVVLAVSMNLALLVGVFSFFAEWDRPLLYSILAFASILALWIIVIPDWALNDQNKPQKQKGNVTIE